MIVSAACRAKVNGEFNTFPVMRHSDFFYWMKLLHCDYNKEEVEQGFLNWDAESSTTTFVDRIKAFQIAQACGQINKERPLQPLYSEDLW